MGLNNERHITEKELKIAAKQINLQFGVINLLIQKVRENQINKKMRNNKETPVSLLVEQFNLQAYAPHVNQALQMESQKQQKYNEMFAMLEECFRFTKIVQDSATSALVLRNEIEQLIKEAKEL
jgi:translation initiation factor 2 alpha subunit (eIF-2alpha)